MHAPLSETAQQCIKCCSNANTNSEHGFNPRESSFNWETGNENLNRSTKLLFWCFRIRKKPQHWRELHILLNFFVVHWQEPAPGIAENKNYRTKILQLFEPEAAQNIQRPGVHNTERMNFHLPVSSIKLQRGYPWGWGVENLGQNPSPHRGPGRASHWSLSAFWRWGWWDF